MALQKLYNGKLLEGVAPLHRSAVKTRNKQHIPTLSKRILAPFPNPNYSSSGIVSGIQTHTHNLWKPPLTLDSFGNYYFFSNSINPFLTIKILTIQALFHTRKLSGWRSTGQTVSRITKKLANAKETRRAKQNTSARGYAYCDLHFYFIFSSL